MILERDEIVALERRKDLRHARDLRDHAGLGGLPRIGVDHHELHQRHRRAFYLKRVLGQCLFLGVVYVFVDAVRKRHYQCDSYDADRARERD